MSTFTTHVTFLSQEYLGMAIDYRPFITSCTSPCESQASVLNIILEILHRIPNS